MHFIRMDKNNLIYLLIKKLGKLLFNIVDSAELNNPIKS